MMRRMSLARLAPVLALALLVGACSDDEKPTDPPAGVVADFVLTDVNPNSATAAQAVSPRDYLQKVSAWYFGHAT